MRKGGREKRWYEWPWLAPKPVDTRVADAKRLLQAYWGPEGGDPGEIAAACRRLKLAELVWVRAWIPAGNPGSTTAQHCARAREIVDGVIAEKGPR